MRRPSVITKARNHCIFPENDGSCNNSFENVAAFYTDPALKCQFQSEQKWIPHQENFEWHYEVLWQDWIKWLSCVYPDRAERLSAIKAFPKSKSLFYSTRSVNLGPQKHLHCAPLLL